MKKTTWKALNQAQRNRLREGQAIVPPAGVDDADLTLNYLQRKGYGRQVRLEFELLTVEDIRWMALELSKISERLSHIAWEKDADPLMKVMLARYALYTETRYGPRKRARKPRKTIVEVVREVTMKT